jgi:hypothetical protein
MQTLTHILSYQINAIGKAKINDIKSLLRIVASQNKLNLSKDLNKCRNILEKQILNN